MNNLRCTTHNIANKGFSGIRRFVARFNFCVTWQIRNQHRYGENRKNYRKQETVP